MLDLSVDQVEGLLAATSTGAGSRTLDQALFAHAESVTSRFFGRDVYYRGIVEFSNVGRGGVCVEEGWRHLSRCAAMEAWGVQARSASSATSRMCMCTAWQVNRNEVLSAAAFVAQVCENDCGYCGIRKHQRRARRYTMPRDEVVEVAEWAFRHRMGTLMLQSGELNTPQRLRYLTQVVRDIKGRTAALDAAQRGLDPAALTPSAPGVGLCVALSGARAPSAGSRDYDTRKSAPASARRATLRLHACELWSTASVLTPVAGRCPPCVPQWANCPGSSTNSCGMRAPTATCCASSHQTRSSTPRYIRPRRHAAAKAAGVHACQLPEGPQGCMCQHLRLRGVMLHLPRAEMGEPGALPAGP